MPSETTDSANNSDKSLTEAIEHRLQADPDIAAHLIDVTSESGVVTLSGTVDNLFARTRAAQIAQATRGVYVVKNNLNVRPVRRPDNEIRQDVLNAIRQDPAAESYDVNVSVRNGVVGLKGEVQSYQERKLAESIASSIRGVRQVNNAINIVFNADRSDAEIADDIRSRLENDVHTSRNAITVNVQDGQAKLSGTAASAIEKTWAKADAWVFGVTDVDVSGLKVKTSVPSGKERNQSKSGQLAKSSSDSDAKGGMTQSESGSSGAGKSTDQSSKSGKRTDAQIKDAINNALLMDPRVYSFNPDIEVEDGAVTLTGTVTNLKAKQAAEHDARNIVGVTRVRNLLKVRTKGQPNDATIERNVYSAISRRAELDDDNINVSVLNGKVTLTGTVDTYAQLVGASDAASGVKGVLDVEDKLNVPYHFYYSQYNYPRLYPYSWNRTGAGYVWPLKSDSELRQDIKDQMFWSPFVDADEVNASVNNGVATLTGTVDSAAERRSATKNAYDAGVTDVKNKLRLYDDYDGIFDF